MVDIIDAVNIVQKSNPDKRIVSCMDMTTFYAFQMLGRSVKLRGLLDIPASPAMYAVNKKDGREFIVHAYQPTDGVFKSKVDINDLLDREDLAFVKQYEKVLSSGGSNA